MDLVFIEEAFERLLLDYDRVFSAMAIPACLWRRTGEIYKGNREFAELVGLDSFMLRDVRLITTQAPCRRDLMRVLGPLLYLPAHGGRVCRKLLGGVSRHR
jgi:PAS domain-containing protein